MIVMRSSTCRSGRGSHITPAVKAPQPIKDGFMVLQPRTRWDFAELHSSVGNLNEQLSKLALQGETLAETCLRLGSQHPIVRQRDHALRAYRRAASTLQ